MVISSVSENIGVMDNFIFCEWDLSCCKLSRKEFGGMY
jgi:hypothetical protein